MKNSEEKEHALAFAKLYERAKNSGLVLSAAKNNFCVGTPYFQTDLDSLDEIRGFLICYEGLKCKLPREEKNK